MNSLSYGFGLPSETATILSAAMPKLISLIIFVYALFFFLSLIGLFEAPMFASVVVFLTLFALWTVITSLFYSIKSAIIT